MKSYECPQSYAAQQASLASASGSRPSAPKQGTTPINPGKRRGARYNSGKGKGKGK